MTISGHNYNLEIISEFARIDGFVLLLNEQSLNVNELMKSYNGKLKKIMPSTGYIGPLRELTISIVEINVLLYASFTYT